MLDQKSCFRHLLEDLFVFFKQCIPHLIRFVIVLLANFYKLRRTKGTTFFMCLGVFWQVGASRPKINEYLVTQNWALVRSTCQKSIWNHCFLPLQMLVLTCLTRSFLLSWFSQKTWVKFSKLLIFFSIGQHDSAQPLF